jgi:hypothetical protein
LKCWHRKIYRGSGFEGLRPPKELFMLECSRESQDPMRLLIYLSEGQWEYKDQVS